MNRKSEKARNAKIERIAEIAEIAFKARFNDVKIVRIDVKPGVDHDGDPVVDVNFVCDGDYTQLNGEGLQKLHTEIVSKTWRDPEDDLDLGFPLVHFIDKADLEGLATA